MKLSELGQYKTVTDLGRENKREALLKEEEKYSSAYYHFCIFFYM